MGWEQSKPERCGPLEDAGIKEVKAKECKEKKDTERKYKVLIVGNSEVGKTTLRDVMLGKEFNEHTERTYGAAGIHLELSFCDEIFHICLYDTPCVKEGKSIVLSYLDGTDCLVMTYEAYDIEGLKETVDKWLPEFMEKNEAKSITHIFILGNKGDHRRNKTPNSCLDVDPLKLGETYKVKVTINQCSSKTGENIREFFWNVVEGLAENQSACHLKKLKMKAGK